MAFPLEVTRSETWSGFELTPILAFMASGRSVVTGPSHSPARVFRASKDFCASVFGISDFGAGDWAKATVESDSRTVDTIKRQDFIFILLLEEDGAVGLIAD